MDKPIYKPEAVLKSSGKTVDTVTTPASGENSAGGEGNEHNEEGAGAGDEEAQKIAAEKETAEIAEAQKNMTADEIVADNQKRAEAKQSPEQKEAAEKVKAEEERTKINEAAYKKALDDILAKVGVTSLDELDKKIPKPEETPEQKQERESKLEANVAKFAVDNKLMTMDAITAVKNMSKVDKMELARENFAKEYKEENKDRTDTDGTTKVPVTAAEIEDAFNDQFHINSDNATLKKTGEKLLDRYVDSIKGDDEQKYNDIVETYKEFEAKKEFSPVWRAALKTVVANVPKELTFGEGENQFVVPTADMDLAAIEKMYANDAGFEAFYSTKGSDKSREQLQNAFMDTLKAKNIDKIAAAALEAGKTIGLKNGTAIGAVNSFNDKDSAANSGKKQVVVDVKKKYAEDQAKHYSGAKQ